MKLRSTAIALAAIAFASIAPSVEAAPLRVGINAASILQPDAAITEIAYRRGGAVRRSTVVGPRGGVYHSRTAVRGAAVVRPGYRGGGTRWVRPGNYWWPVGGAIAAGAAIGFVGAATAAAWAGAPPAPGYCWYYTDASKTQGFWDACPR